MSMFISFTTRYEYEYGNKYRRPAETQLNDWLKANPDVEVISWKPCTLEGEWCPIRKTYEPALCIIVEYKRKETTHSVASGNFSGV